MVGPAPKVRRPRTLLLSWDRVTLASAFSRSAARVTSVSRETTDDSSVFKEATSGSRLPGGGRLSRISARVLEAP